MGWALWEKNDREAALTAMRKMSRIPSGAHRMVAGIHACLGNQREAKGALAVFLKDSPGDSISQQRKQWEKNYTAPGASSAGSDTCGSRACRSDRVCGPAEDRLAAKPLKS